MDEKKQIEEMVKTAEKALGNHDFDCPHTLCPYLRSAITCAGCAIIEAFRKENYRKQEWISVDERLPDEFVSVLGYMTDAGDFPPVRECYLVGGVFFFPALNDRHPVSHWMPLPEPPKMKGGA